MTFAKTLLMKPSNEKLISTLAELKNQFDASDRQRWILERCQREINKLNSRSVRTQLILNAISEGNFTIKDISSFTKIPYNSIHNLIPRLLQQKKIIETSYKSSDRRGRAERLFKINE